MHGRVKVRTSEEQAEAKKREQQEKLKIYSSVTAKIFSKKRNNEFDEELLELTRGILEKNPDFYTFWNYRRETLLHLKTLKEVEDLKKLCLVELDLTQHCLKVNPKSYSAWHHRFWTMGFHPEPDWKKELKLCSYFLSQDERNFHCWDYRRLVAWKCHVCPEEELDYSTKLIETNFSNYSAWHYRSKLLPLIYFDSNKRSIKEDVLLKEFELIQNAAFTDPDDQSVWFYHRWLLGKNKVPQEILNVSVLKSQQTIAVLFSEPIKINYNVLKVNIDDVPIDLKWRTVDPNMPASTLWLGELSKDLVHGDSFNKVTVEFFDGFIRDTLSCNVDGINSSTWKQCDRNHMFRSRLSAATQDVLEQELTSCQQLNELEPNCKWTVFTSVLLMRALKDTKFDSQIEECMKQLANIDSSRKNYYKDLGSKFTIENTLETLPFDATEVNLSNKNLSSLHHFEQFLWIERIDVSSNNLKSIYAFKYLICLKTANLDNNHLTNLKGVEDLKNLEILTVANNLIKEVDVLENLKSCLSLKELCLKDNPVISEDNNFAIDKSKFHFKITNSLKEY